MPSPFTIFLSDHLDEVNEHLASFFSEQTDNRDIESYLYSPLSRFSANAGKRHRPLICMLACQAVGGTLSDALDVASAIEHFQSAALIHDDIADNGQLRRGEPCLHISEGEGIAINCGDYALTLVTSSVLGDKHLDDSTKIRLLGELVDMMMRTVEGQALDLGWVRDDRFDLSVDDYLTMAKLKTAHYSGATPLACGAIVGKGSEDQIETLRTFGLNTGLAFQIQDDLLNLVGTEESRNKDFRSDITEGKRTLVAVHALRDERFHEELEAILRSGTTDPAKLDRAVQIFDEAGSIEFARDFSLRLTADAKNQLDRIDIDPRCKEFLLSMADFFIERLY
ncbi:MAG: polyprenyl synthetase family protein [Collinsella sp.]|nr:polyprenyl synthetase family protein [Collinsella sp.]